jgi:hypothetical protein
MISIMLLPFYPPEQSRPLPIDEEDGWAPERSGHCREEKNLLPCRESNLSSSVALSIAHHYTVRAIRTLHLQEVIYSMFLFNHEEIREIFRQPKLYFRMRLYQILSTRQNSGWIKLYFK